MTKYLVFLWFVYLEDSKRGGIITLIARRGKEHFNPREGISMSSGTKISLNDQLLVHELTTLAQKVLTLAMDISAAQIQVTHSFSRLVIEDIEDIFETNPPVDIITSNIPSFDDRFQKTVKTVKLLREGLFHNTFHEKRITQKELHDAYMLCLEIANNCYKAICEISN